MNPIKRPVIRSSLPRMGSSIRPQSSRPQPQARKPIAPARPQSSTKPVPKERLRGSVQLIDERTESTNTPAQPQRKRQHSAPSVSARASERTVRRQIDLDEAVDEEFGDIYADDGGTDDARTDDDFSDDNTTDDGDDSGADDLRVEDDDFPNGSYDNDSDDDSEGDGIPDERTARRESDRQAVRRISGQTGFPLAKARRIRRHFGDKAETIVDMLTSNDHDGAETMLYQTILTSLVDVMPAVEGAIHKSKGTKGLMGYNQCLSQIRETLMDIQARRDRGAVGQLVVEKHIRPAMLNSAQQMVLALSQLLGAFPFPTQEARTRFSHEVVAPLQQELAKFLNEQIIKLAQDVSQELS